MKNINTKFTLQMIFVSILINISIKGQTIINCFPPASNSAIIFSSCSNCNTYDDYLPVAGDSDIVIRLNFHYLKMAVAPGKFDSATIVKAQATVNDINNIFDSLYKPQIRNGAAAGVAYIKRPRIKFKFNNFFLTVDSLGYGVSYGMQWPVLNSHINDSNAIDIVFHY